MRYINRPSIFIQAIGKGIVGPMWRTQLWDTRKYTPLVNIVTRSINIGRGDYQKSIIKQIKSELV